MVKIMKTLVGLLGYKNSQLSFPSLQINKYFLISSKAESFLLYDKSFIGQASSVKMAGYWPRSFLPFLRTETKQL